MILLRNKLVRAVILRQVPDTNVSSAIAADDLALVWVDDDVVDGGAVVIASLDGTAASLPDLDGAILGTCDHPFALAVESDAGYIACVALEGEDGVWVG